MIIIFLGPSGSGKGTQAKLLAKKYDLELVVMGDLLRQAAKQRRDVDDLINKGGKLVPAEVAYSVMTQYLNDNFEKNIILDGFPRTPEQYGLFKKWLDKRNAKINLALILNISEEESVKRLSGRRTDPETGKIYNLTTSPKPGPEIILEKLTQRDDDTPEKIKKRLSWYKSEVMPLIDKLKSEGVEVVEVDGERSIEKIQSELVSIVGERLS